MSGVMTPVLLVAVIGLVCAGLLVFASKVFHVAVDERVPGQRSTAGRQLRRLRIRGMR